jgi:quinol monooxygenase YgiN
MPVLIATITPNSGQLDAVETVLKSLMQKVHDEDGCELYALHRGEDRFVLVEKWRDMAALEAHRSGDENHGNSPESITEIPHLLRAVVGH